MIDSLWSYTLLAAGSLVPVLNPFAIIPPFVAMTGDNTVAERKAMARRAALIAAGVLTAFALLGLRILGFFGVSQAAFQIAGGLVLVRVAFELLQGGGALKVTPEERAEGTLKNDISVSPLAIPILCGPGSITAAILVSGEASTAVHLAVLVATIGLAYAGIFVLLRFVSEHSHRLGDTPIKVSSRLMGLILVAVSVQFVLEGIRTADLF
jgi:multiple antibiotic resistance protein